jgi:hypothetical protein
MFGKALTPRWNFKNITNAMLLLFRTATGDGWFDLIYDCSVEPPFCTPTGDPEIVSWLGPDVQGERS